MQKYHGSAVLSEDPLALRRQIDQLQEHINLLKMENAIIQERMNLIQQQHDISLPAGTEKAQQLNDVCDETVRADFHDTEESYDDAMSGISFALEGANGFVGSRSHSRLSAVFSDHSVVVQTQPQRRGSTSKLRAKLRNIVTAHRRFQSTDVPHEPPALFQGLVSSVF
ncbi:hypothetical protein K503DRAFT_357541 [Rhizopogon vinicolor AM-OR11-026]|uniref:Uncharacterized protein n=1 Tax=Rhizopogon vinicolor AM-OR11-026 TaxID=1314800 RepID=A0A1B7MSP1_9AGAM|nr:hypothetical protein K503DRAFT_357541 [Rhizopogon vinicolor AM-OR11-026]